MSALAILVTCLVSLIVMRKIRQAIQTAEEKVRETENKLLSSKEELNSLSKRVVEQSSRIAWLESRVRNKPVPAGTQSPEPEPQAGPTKLSLTERRHRVLSLARRGFDTDAISSLLNTPNGEIELILSLTTQGAGLRVEG